MKKVKRNIIIAAVLLFVCAAVYLNWSYNNSWGAADPAMVKAEDENMASLGTDTLPTWRMRFLPSFCFSSSFFLRVMSPP